jgi:hypothetical protein
MGQGRISQGYYFKIGNLTRTLKLLTFDFQPLTSLHDSPATC